MDTNKKAYIIINSNEEGYNFLGVFSTRENAEKACNEHNTAERNCIRILYNEHPEEEIEDHLRFYEEWDLAEVVEVVMDSMI